MWHFCWKILCEISICCWEGQESFLDCLVPSQTAVKSLLFAWFHQAQQWNSPRERRELPQSLTASQRVWWWGRPCIALHFSLCYLHPPLDTTRQLGRCYPLIMESFILTGKAQYKSKTRSLQQSQHVPFPSFSATFNICNVYFSW